MEHRREQYFFPYYLCPSFYSYLRMYLCLNLRSLLCLYFGSGCLCSDHYRPSSSFCCSFRKKAEQGKDGSKHLAKSSCKSCTDNIPVQYSDQQIVQDNIEKTASLRDKKSGFTATGCNEDALEIHLNHIEGKKEKEDDAVRDGRCKHLICTAHPGKQRSDHRIPRTEAAAPIRIVARSKLVNCFLAFSGLPSPSVRLIRAEES